MTMKSASPKNAAAVPGTRMVAIGTSRQAARRLSKDSWWTRFNDRLNEPNSIGALLMTGAQGWYLNW
ncbi:hypothetical protein [Sphingomonas oryzagri]